MPYNVWSEDLNNRGVPHFHEGNAPGLELFCLKSCGRLSYPHVSTVNILQQAEIVIFTASILKGAFCSCQNAVV